MRPPEVSDKEIKEYVNQRRNKLGAGWEVSKKPPGYDDSFWEVAVFRNGQRVELSQFRDVASFSIDLVDNTIGYVTTKKLVFFETAVKSVVDREVASAASHRAMVEGNLWI